MVNAGFEPSSAVCGSLHLSGEGDLAPPAALLLITVSPWTPDFSEFILGHF